MPEVAAVPKLSLRNSTALAVVLGVITALALWQRLSVDFNGPYIDESDYLYVSRLLEAKQPWNTYTYIFSSHLPLHVLGFGERLGGLLGARLLAGALGLASLAFFYGAARALFVSRRAAGFATLIVLVAAPHIFISKFATYDVIAFCFFSLSLWLLFAGLCSARYGWLLLALASVAFAAAVLSKYVVVVYAPLLAVAVAVRRPRLLPFALLPCGGLLAEYVVRHWADLKQLYQIQVVGAHARNSTRGQILTIAAFYLAPVLLLALGTLVTILRRVGTSWRSLRLPLLLLMMALPLVAMHVRSGDMVSMYKHMAYPVAMLALLAGWGLARASRTRWWPPVLVLGALVALGYWQTRRMERAFPDFRPMLAELAPKLGPATSILSEEAYVFRYRFGGATTKNRIFEMTWFDNNGDGERTPQDVIDAVWDGKPDYVMLHGQILPGLAATLREKVLPHQYYKVYERPYELSDVMTRIRRGKVELWRRRGVYKGQYPL